MSYRSRFVILKWISDLRLNFNQQLIYIDYLIDISIIKGKSTAYVMDEDRFLRLLKEKDLNTPQKALKMLKLLRTRRFPFLTNSVWRVMRSGAKLSDGLRKIQEIFHLFLVTGYRNSLKIKI